MTIFQLLMLGASAYFAFKIYEHIYTLQDNPSKESSNDVKTKEAFSPFSPEALVLKADTAVEDKEYKKAYAFLLEANAKENHNEEILFKLGYVLEKLEEDDEALIQLKHSLEVQKDNPFTHNLMATIYKRKGEYTSAKLHLNASLEIDEHNPVTYFNYGNLLVEMGHNEEAITMYEKAFQLDNDFLQAKTELELLKAKHG